MKRMVFLLAFVFLGTTALTAQRGNSGWGQNSNYGRMFNPKTVETFSGSIDAVERILPDKKMSYGLHLKVKTERETISVHLGPAWYLDNQDIQFEKGDQVTVTGSRITYQNTPAIIAIEVVKNDNVLSLRDGNGYPVWSGWRKKGMCKKRT